MAAPRCARIVWIYEQVSDLNCERCGALSNKSRELCSFLVSYLPLARGLKIKRTGAGGALRHLTCSYAVSRAYSSALLQPKRKTAAPRTALSVNHRKCYRMRCSSILRRTRAIDTFAAHTALRAT